MENFRERRLERQLKSQQGISIGIAVLLILSIVGNVFLFMRNNSTNIEKEDLIRENSLILSDKQAVEAANSRLQAEIATLNAQVNEIKESALALEAEISIRNSRIANLRGQIAEIERLRVQVAELETLKTEYETLEKERLKLVADLEALGEKLNNLQSQNENLQLKIDQAAYLRAFNICVHNHRDRWLGRPVTMEVARRVNRTTVSFEINGNILVDPGHKSVHVVMKDQDGDIVNPSSETFTIKDTGNNINYTEYTSIQYNHKSIPLKFTIIHDDSLNSGNYSLEVYIDGENAGISEFSLE